MSEDQSLVPARPIGNIYCGTCSWTDRTLIESGGFYAAGIRFVAPNTRHAGYDQTVLAARACLWAEARAARPERWSGQPRNWPPAGDVWLNPERDTGALKIRDAA